MKKPISVGLMMAKTRRFLMAIIPLVLAGQAFDANAQTVTNLYSFGTSFQDGRDPRSGLVQGSDGNFYGTANQGGQQGHGAVFRISPSGTYTSLYSFSTIHGDGFEPDAGLLQGSDGNFYGTTSSGPGVVFRISPSGSETNLHSFGSSNDGRSPYAGLVQGSDGNLYGTTYYGGTSANCPSGCGTVFQISPGGAYTSLYSFVGSPSDGADPQAGLEQGSDGNFYGTTFGGGTSNLGTVFRISPSGNETNLHSFVGPPGDGQHPVAGLVQGSDGNFYGTTHGPNASVTTPYGTVFRISPSGTYTNLYSFGGYPNDGRYPYGLVQGSDGNFYGTTGAGGTNNFGTLFRISPDGSYSNLYSFVGSPNDGQDPQAGLVQGSDGNFYGTTINGGTNGSCVGGCGTVFKLTLPLSPPPYPINQITGVQRSGSDIVFNISSIAGETYQLQFSSSMTPTNWVNVPVSVTNSIGALLTLTNFGGAVWPQGFYRFDITP